MRGVMAAAALAASAAAGWAAAEESGRIVTGKPQDIVLEARRAADGGPALSAEAFTLTLGSYYRFNFACPDVDSGENAGFHFEATELLANAHLRVVSVGDMELYMQGMSFRAVECDGPGTARFSFNPMRAGTYAIVVRDHANPPHQAAAMVTVE